MGREDVKPPAGTPESHWGTKDPAGQPDASAVFGLRRMVIEARDRLGKDATPEVIAEELRARGVSANPDDVRKCCSEPY